MTSPHSPLYAEGYADAIADKPEDDHFRFYWPYRKGYADGKLTRANREEMDARRRAA